MKIVALIAEATVAYLVALMADYAYVLLRFSHKIHMTSFTGLRIDSVISKQGTKREYFLTWQALIIYLLFVAVWLLLALFLVKKKHKFYKSTNN